VGVAVYYYFKCHHPLPKPVIGHDIEVFPSTLAIQHMKVQKS